MALPATYANKADSNVTGTAAQLFVSPAASRIGVRIQLNDAGEGARVFVGTANTVTTTTGVLAVISGPYGAKDIYCDSTQTLWVITAGATCAITAWEVLP